MWTSTTEGILLLLLLGQRQHCVTSNRASHRLWFLFFFLHWLLHQTAYSMYSMCSQLHENDSLWPCVYQMGDSFFFKVVYSVPFRDCGNNAAPCFTHCDTGRTAPPVRPLRWRIWPHPPPPPHSTEGLRYIPTITKIIWQNLTRLLTNLPSLLIEPDSVYKVCVCVFLCVTAI